MNYELKVSNLSQPTYTPACSKQVLRPLRIKVLKKVLKCLKMQIGSQCGEAFFLFRSPPPEMRGRLLTFIGNKRSCVPAPLQASAESAVCLIVPVCSSTTCTNLDPIKSVEPLAPYPGSRGRSLSAAGCLGVDTHRLPRFQHRMRWNTSWSIYLVSANYMRIPLR